MRKNRILKKYDKFKFWLKKTFFAGYNSCDAKI